ncbi:MAG: CTP synthase (glutamine hydrolyzing) [Nanohaloarchaea archaeon]|nr:CTP synthase (glutamine hydrolyzing) [Candidatus Nanohaloarchaea archaeon]
MPKWIFITGGVLSGLGKGLVSASVSKLLQKRGLEMVPIKCDGYLNVDPGTMNPHEHGEVFVLEDGTEVDMDFGHYERFLGTEGKGEWNLTSGKIFKEVIRKEREGEYLGKTVQMVPHVTDEIKKCWKNSAEDAEADVVAIEIGGTVGDMENQFYLEAARQIIAEENEEETYLIHTTLVPYLETTGEQKTKPTQHSVKELRQVGLSPDMVVGRSEKELSDSTVDKISLFCDVSEKEVVSDPNLEHVYELPLEFDRQNVGEIIGSSLNLPKRNGGLDKWRQRVESLSKDPVAKIAICGKYMEIDDSYVSVEEALKHSAAELGGSIEIEQVDTENLDLEELERFDGVIVPGGFGSRGVEGKIDAIEYCRENNIPFLGLCYGMQLMVVEFSRNVLGLDAASEEFESGEEHLVVAEMPEQKDIDEKGGTMRLGGYTAELEGKVKQIYGKQEVSERHRHRFEVKPDYHEQLEQNGLKLSGKQKDGELAEFAELENHPFMVGTQAHPEFKSSFENPSPLFLEFVRESS